MFFVLLRCCIVLMLSALCGCSGVPAFDTPSELTVAHIVDQIQCEVSQAATRFSEPDQWWVVADLTLQVDDSADLSPKVSFVQPLVVDGTNFNFGAGAQLKGARQRIYSESLELQVTKANPASCRSLKDKFDLTGDLGIIETVRMGTGSYDTADGVSFPMSADKKTAFGQTIQFVVTKNVTGVGPTWNLVHFVGTGAFFGAERIDTHKLIISFAKVPKVALAKGVARAGVSLTTLGIGSATDRATSLNTKMLLQSLPTFRLSR